MIFRVGILVVASVAALAVSPVNSKQRLKRQHAKLSGCSSTQETELGGEKCGDDISEEDRQDVEEAKVVNSKNIVKKMEMKRLTLERKVLELYNLKEKLSSIACLQNKLADKTAEIDKLDFAIFVLRGEIKDLKEITRQGNLEVKQLEMAKKMIKEMQIKNGNASQIKEQIVVLEEQLSGFKTNETSTEDALVKNRLEAVENIELQVLKMRRINKELELEKREILVKLYDAHAKLSAHAKIYELRNANGDLSDEVERLQKSRFDMVEELVYQRWLNACLRSEIKEHQTLPRKTLQKEVHKTLNRKPSKVITRYPDTDSSSSYTTSTDSEEMDNSSTIGSFSSSQRSIGKCSSVVSSPNKSSIGSPSDRSGIIRRFSTSMLPSKTSMLRNKVDGTSTETMETPNFCKVRRVSFNDAVEMISLAGEKHEFRPSEVSSVLESDRSSDPNRRFVDKGDRDAEEVSWIGNVRSDEGLHSSISNVIPSENKMESMIDPHIFAFLFLVFGLLLCFIHLSAKIY